jgi:hypothetical protein
MSLLEKVTQLKKEGMSEKEIITILQEENESPKDIMDALNQSQIKKAISAEEETSTDGMMPSMMQDEEDLAPIPEGTEQQAQEEIYAPQVAVQQEQNYYTPRGREEEYFEGDSNYAEETPSDQTYSGEYSYNQDATIEIAEQVVAEKMKKFQFQLRDAMEFKTLFESKLEDINSRLARMEKMFDKMQLTVIDKVSSYGEHLDLIKKEMNMLEDSFAKVISPVLDKKSQQQESSEQNSINKKTSTKKQSREVQYEE